MITRRRCKWNRC